MIDVALSVYRRYICVIIIFCLRPTVAQFNKLCISNCQVRYAVYATALITGS